MLCCSAAVVNDIGKQAIMDATDTCDLASHAVEFSTCQFENALLKGFKSWRGLKVRHFHEEECLMPSLYT